MAIKINYSKNITGKSPLNLVLFVDEKLNIDSLKKYITNNEYSYIGDLLKSSDLKKNIFVFEVSSKKNNLNFY